MIIGFLGAPNSGKTTIAAKVFAELKQAGQPNVEFVAEEARRYIAEYKAKSKSGGCILNDKDQCDIMTRQENSERIMHLAVGASGIVVTDSSALNALWYMDDTRRISYPWTINDIQYCEWLRQNALLFYCPIVGISTADALRIHSVKEAKLVDAKIGEFMVHEKGWLPIKALLTGSIDMRVSKVLENVWERLQS